MLPITASAGKLAIGGRGARFILAGMSSGGDDILTGLSAEAACLCAAVDRAAALLG
jgi:hypothetical protein